MLVDVSHLGDAPFDATVRGVGLRIAIAAQNLSATASLSLGSVAASATIHSVATKVRVVPVGFESAGWTS